MGKKNRDRDRGRTATDGLRRTASVRRIEARIDARFAAIPANGVELDLSAFEERENLIDDRDPLLARVQELARPGRTISMQNRKRDDEPSRRALERKTDTRLAGRSVVTLAGLRKARAEALRDKQAKAVDTANHDHLQPKASTQSRKERVRAHCKQRPEKTKGRGGSRAFVPWCDRKR